MEWGEGGREGEEEKREGGVGVEWRKGAEWYLCDCHSLAGSEKQKKILQEWILGSFWLILTKLIFL